jgi:hypothetical protein
MERMTTVHDISPFDHVELLEPIEDVPAAATGAVLEFRDDGKTAMVEFTSMPAKPLLDRVKFVPIEKLRLVEKRGEAASSRTGTGDR